jgi:hypothetical protein
MADPAIFRVVIENVKAVRALGLVQQTLEELMEDLPWRPDVTAALIAMQYAMRHLDLQRSER